MNFFNGGLAFLYSGIVLLVLEKKNAFMLSGGLIMAGIVIMVFM